MNFNYNDVNFLSMKNINNNIKILREKKNKSFSTFYSSYMKNLNNNEENISYYFFNDNNEKNESNLLKNNKNEKKYKSCSSIFSYDSDNKNDSNQNKNNDKNLLIKFFLKKNLSQNKNKILDKILNNKKSTSIIFDKNESIKFNNYLFGKIFRNIFREKTKVLNNKYNLLYSENEEQYNTTLKKRNKYPILNENYSKNRINLIKKKINFMKGISDFSFPKIILNKLSLENKLYNELKKNKSLIKNKKKFIIPYLQKDKEIYNNNLLQTMKLQKSLIIKKQIFI